MFLPAIVVRRLPSAHSGWRPMSGGPPPRARTASTCTAPWALPRASRSGLHCRGRRPVWLINADGSLCMNLGCLLTEASQAASNLKHFVVANGVYQTVGGLPMVNDGRTDYAAMARAAGFQRARTIETLDDLEQQLPAIAGRGWAFAHRVAGRAGDRL